MNTAAGKLTRNAAGDGAPAAFSVDETLKASISEQLEEAEAELRNRARYYPGRLKAETAERKFVRLRSIAKTLAYIAQDPDFFRFVLQHKSDLVQILGVLQHVLERGPYLPVQIISDAEAELLLSDPATRAVVEAFPAAAIGVRSTRPKSDPLQLTDEEAFDQETGEVAA